MDWERASAELVRMLNPKHVQPAKEFGPKGDYLEGWHCMAEANRIFGFGGWQYKVVKCDVVMQQERKIGKAQKNGWGVTYVAMVRVTVAGVTREDVGAGHGYDVDLGLAHESAVKEAVTDALKRSLRSFGNPFGLALYDKERAQVGVEPSQGAKEAAAALMQADSIDALKAAVEALPQPLRDDAHVQNAKAQRYHQLKQREAA